MKRTCVKTRVKRGLWTVVFYTVATLAITNVFAVPLPLESDGMAPKSLSIDELFDAELSPRGGTLSLTDKVLKDNLDRFIGQMKTALKRGDLSPIRSLGKRLKRIHPESVEVRALYSIYLASTQDIQKARTELDVAAQLSPSSPLVLYAKAMILRLEGKFDDALRVCKQAIDIDQAHPFPRNILGRIYLDLGQYKEAHDSFKKTIELAPRFLPGYTNLGAVAHVMGNFDQSLGYFQKAIEQNLMSYSAYYGLALAHESTNNPAAAVKALQKSLDLKPDNLLALQKLGHLQLQTALYADALATGRKMKARGLKDAYEILADAALHLGDVKQAIAYLKQAPSDRPRVEYLLGYCFMVKEQYDDALAQMERTLTLDQRHFGAYAARAAIKFHLGKRIDQTQDLSNQWNESLGKLLSFIKGVVFASKADWAQSLKHFQHAEGLTAGFSMAGIDKTTLSHNLKKAELSHLNFGILYYFRNLHVQARSQFEKALHVNKESLFANYWAAIGYLDRGDRDNAAILLERSTKKAPRFFAALYAAGELHFTQGKPDVAAKYYQRALAVKKHPGLALKLGLYFENTDAYEKAEERYQEVIHLSPNWFVGYNQLAWLYAKQGIKLEKALKLARKADALQPENASILDTVGWIRHQQKDHSAALGTLERALKANPKNPTILYHIGVVYHALNRASLAAEALKRALAVSSSFDEAGDAKTLLSAISLR